MNGSMMGRNAITLRACSRIAGPSGLCHVSLQSRLGSHVTALLISDRHPAQTASLVRRKSRLDDAAACDAATSD